MRREYDLRGGKRNSYAKRLGARDREALLQRFLRAEHLVRLDDDVAAAFKDATSVSEALRIVMRLRELGPRPRRPRARRAA